jgi:hypothetical protein
VPGGAGCFGAFAGVFEINFSRIYGSRPRHRSWINCFPLVASNAPVDSVCALVCWKNQDVRQHISTHAARRYC